MRPYRALVAALFAASLFAPLPSPAGAQESSAVTVVRDVSLVTLDSEATLDDHAVIVEGDSIVWVGPDADASIPDGAVVVEGGGRFLLPGLADLHLHMGTADSPLFLANGITTVREMNGAPAHLALRDSIARGLRIGPRLFVTSPLLAGAEQPWRHVLVPDAQTAYREAHAAKDAGYDAIKAYDGLSAEAYAALAEASETLDLPLVGHVPREVGLDGVLRAGQRSLEHVEQIAYATVGHAPDPAAIPEIASQIAGSGGWVVPTLAAQRILTRARTPAYDAGFEAPEIRYVDPGLLEWWKSLRSPDGAAEPSPDDPRRRRAEAFYAFQRDLVRALHEAGVPLLVGTDTPNPLLVPGFSIHLELAALIDAGIPALDVLRMATRDAARFLGEDGEWGVIAPGAAADLILLDANPLERIETLKAPVGVMTLGTWLDRGDLDRMLERAAADRRS